MLQELNKLHYFLKLKFNVNINVSTLMSRVIYTETFIIIKIRGAVLKFLESNTKNNFLPKVYDLLLFKVFS